MRLDQYFIRVKDLAVGPGNSYSVCIGQADFENSYNALGTMLEPHNTNMQGEAWFDPTENFGTTTAPRTRRRAREEDGQTHVAPAHMEPSNAGTSNARVTTKEIRQIIEHLHAAHYRRANHAHTSHPDRTKRSETQPE